jgi:phosphate transport system protein
MESREVFLKRLAKTKDDVLVMGGMVENSLSRSVASLKNRELALAHRVIAEDTKINEKRFEIENDCIDIIATQQPVAADLRTIVTILNISSELERIGDYGVGIAKIAIMIGDEPSLKPLIDIPRMSEITIEMVHGSIKSFVDNDAKFDTRVVSMDTTVDNLYDQVFRELLTFMMADPKTISRATRLIWVAHNLERAADRATNICERVVYTVTGKMEEIGSSNY